MPSEQSRYFELNDLTNEVRLYNGSEWVSFNRDTLASAEGKLSAVKQLLEDPGIDKDQILMLLGPITC